MPRPCVFTRPSIDSKSCVTSSAVVIPNGIGGARSPPWPRWTVLRARIDSDDRLRWDDASMPHATGAQSAATAAQQTSNLLPTTMALC